MLAIITQAKMIKEMSYSCGCLFQPPTTNLDNVHNASCSLLMDYFLTNKHYFSEKSEGINAMRDIFVCDLYH